MSSSTSTSSPGSPAAAPAGEESRYRRFFVLALALYGVSIPLNVVVDPFGVFGVETPCFSEHRDIATFNRMTTVHQAERAEPRLVVLGSSRVAAFDAGELERRTGVPSYVMMVAAADIYELRRHFEHYVERKPIERVLLGLDFYAFNPSRRPYTGFDEARLTGSAPPWKDYAVVATHYQALSASAKVVRQCLSEVFAPAPAPGDAAEQAAPPQTDLGAAIAYARDADLYASPSFEDREAMERELDELRRLLARAREKGIEVTLFTNPVYHEHWGMIFALDHGEAFWRWKRSLVELAPVWDFVGSNSVTRERRNFADTAHYHEPVARMMLQRMLGQEEETLPADFGVRLTLENVDDRLAAEVAAIEPAFIARLQALLRD